MVYFLFSILYISLILLVIYFNKKINLQNYRTVSIIREQHKYNTKTLKLTEEVEGNLAEFVNTYKVYSEKLDTMIKTYDKYSVEWEDNTDSIKKLLSKFEEKHDAVETKFNDKEKELKETFESFKKMYDEMHFYLANSTRKLENRPEEVRRELIQELKEVKKYVFNLSTQHSDHVIKTEKEYLIVFNELSKLADKVVLKKDPTRRSY